MTRFNTSSFAIRLEAESAEVPGGLTTNANQSGKVVLHWSWRRAIEAEGPTLKIAAAAISRDHHPLQFAWRKIVIVEQELGRNYARAPSAMVVTYDLDGPSSS